MTGEPEHGERAQRAFDWFLGRNRRGREPVVLEIHDAAVADRLADYVDETRGRYPPATPPDQRG